MAFLILTSILVSLVSFIIYVILARKERFRLRGKIGLSGPEPHWLMGNLKQIIELVEVQNIKYENLIFIFRRKAKLGYDDSYDWYNKLHKQFGETFG